MTRVIKIGGAALANESWLQSFALHAAQMAEPCVIVHGGGPEITAVSQQLGIATEWNNGKRVTPPAALDAAAMVLTGRINKRIVSALLLADGDAVGLCGVDGGMVRAEVAHNGALGMVGRVTSVRAELLEWLVLRGVTPVVSPISLAADGTSLNVNADEVASAIAAALGATELLYLTDVDGVMVEDRLRATLSVGESAAMVRDGAAWGGMAVKLNAAAEAVAGGIARVRIGGLATMTSDAAGTTLHAELEAVA